MKTSLEPFFTENNITTEVLRNSTIRTATQILYFYYDIKRWYCNRPYTQSYLHPYLLEADMDDNDLLFTLHELDFLHDKCTTYIVPYAKKHIMSCNLSDYINWATPLFFYNALFIYDEHVKYVVLLFTFTEEMLVHALQIYKEWNDGVLLINCNTLEITKVDSLEETYPLVQRIFTAISIQACHVARLY